MKTLDPQPDTSLSPLRDSGAISELALAGILPPLPAPPVHDFLVLNACFEPRPAAP